jgi:hypothetical protein
LNPDSFNSPNETLDYMIETWVQSLNTTDNKIGLFNGQKGPNLADLVSFNLYNDMYLYKSPFFNRPCMEQFILMKAVKCFNMR